MSCSRMENRFWDTWTASLKEGRTAGGRSISRTCGASRVAP